MRIFSTMLFLLLCSFAALAQTYTGKVISVKDGDTIEMLVNGRKIRIRLYGIDCPEKGQAFGDKAKQFTADLCFGKVVKAVQQDVDQWDRVVADIYLDGELLNLRIVEAGYAWHFKRYSNSKVLAEAEKKARRERLGLWQDVHPEAPWEWRKEKNKTLAR